jgi:hypothetical protein
MKISYFYYENVNLCPWIVLNLKNRYCFGTISRRILGKHIFEKKPRKLNKMNTNIFRVLQVEFGPMVTSRGIAALAKLPHLQELLYCNHFHDTHPFIDTTKRLEEFFRMCVRLLPWLQVSGARILFDLYTEHFPTDMICGAFRKLKGRLPSQLGLRQLVLEAVSILPVGVALPNLQTLYLLEPNENFRLMGTPLTSLTELVLKSIPQAPFEQILGQIGHQLRKLAVSVSMDDNLILDRVFRMCPKLQDFQVPDVFCKFIGIREPLDDCNLSCLTDLGFCDESCDISVKTNDLLQILQAAPNLRVLYLNNILFCENGGTEICKALEQKSILQNLEEFYFHYEWSELYGVDPESVLQTKKNCFAVFQCMVLLCPKLSKVKDSTS